MMAEKQDNSNLVTLVLVGAAIWFVSTLQPKGGGDPSTAAAVSAAKQTIPNIRAAYREAFLNAAKGIEDGTIKDQEQWTAFIKANAGAKQREALDAVYQAIDKLDLPASFEGEEKEIAKINREIAGAW
jgi:hypothetical protein